MLVISTHASRHPFQSTQRPTDRANTRLAPEHKTDILADTYLGRGNTILLGAVIVPCHGQGSTKDQVAQEAASHSDRSSSKQLRSAGTRSCDFQTQRHCNAPALAVQHSLTSSCLKCWRNSTPSPPAFPHPQQSSRQASLGAVVQTHATSTRQVRSVVRYLHSPSCSGPHRIGPGS